MSKPIDSFIQGAIKGRYLTLFGCVVLILAGIVAFKLLPIEAYPELANPQVRVITLFPGKGPEEIERLITVPLEKEMNGIPGQISLRSISLYGLSLVTTTFVDSVPITLARQQVLERISQADLPADANPGLDAEVGSLREIYRYLLRSRYYSPMGLRAIQEWDMEKLLRQVPGVIGVVSQGGQTKTYEISVDPGKLIAYGVSLQQVFDAAQNANSSSGGGFIEKNGNALIVRELGLIKGVDDIKRIVIRARPNGTAIRMGDIASVSIGALPRRGQTGKEYDDDVVEGIVLLRRGENPSKVLDTLNERLPGIIQKLPEGVELVPFYDRSRLISLTLKTVGTNVTMGITLVVVLLGLFLLDLRASLITASVIPLAMLVAFICLNLFNVPANLLSLGAVDFGILVDSAVVMTENIVRKLNDEGQELTPRERLLLLTESAKEVASPIIFGVTVIVATFMPIFTFGGVEGKLFRPLATTMVTALVGACFAALTVVPVLCSFFLTKKPLKEIHSPLITIAKLIYVPSLKLSLKHPIIIVILATLAFAGAVQGFLSLGAEFLPHLEEGNIWLRTTIKPGSVSLEESVRVAHEIRRRLLTYPEVTEVLSQEGGPDDGTDPARFADQEYYVDLKPAKQWRPIYHENKEQLVAAIRTDLEQIPGVSYYFTQYIQTTLDEALSGVQGSLVAKVAGPDLAILERLGHQVGSIMRETPGIVDVIVDPLLGQPQLVIDFDRDAAARYGINVQDIRDVVEVAVGGRSATKVQEGERRFSIIVRLENKYRSSQEAVSQILIDTPAGYKIPLSQIAKVREINGATQIWRDAGHRLSTIRANVRGRDLATAVADAQDRVSKEVNLPEGYHVEWSGEFQRQKEASHQLSIVLPVTLLVIITILYLACGTIRGAIVMFSVVPLASIGAVAALHLTHTYFSISAGVGLIALFGIAVMNGILLVSFVNELRREGLPIAEAVYKGALIRMRPVLMTASIAAVGLLPAAFSNEIGSQTQKPFAIVIIGGLVSSTLLTLLVLPALYMFVAPRHERRKEESEETSSKESPRGEVIK